MNARTVPAAAGARDLATLLATCLLAICLLVGCGGGGGSSTATPKPPAATGAAPPSPVATIDVTALAQAFAGVYRGTWSNTTYGSTGPVSADLRVDRTTQTISALVSIGGNVFGGAPPPPETFSGKIADLTSLTFSGHSPTFGDFTVAAFGTGFTMKAVNIPGDRADHLDVVGTLGPDAISATYTVTMKDGSRAGGSATLART